MIKRYIMAIGLVLCAATPVYANTTWATWYKDGKRTANGERFNPNGMTAAHKTFPFGTKLKLTYRGRSVIVRINDRGPFKRNIGLDISRGVARVLGCSGKCLVSYSIVN